MSWCTGLSLALRDGTAKTCGAQVRRKGHRDVRGAASSRTLLDRCDIPGVKVNASTARNASWLDEVSVAYGQDGEGQRLGAGFMAMPSCEGSLIVV
jgi:hypothetical protein